eukprot:GHVU01049840.1.p1 GENE.GHVU01049840.1~~GHVU01049840.1.p1  ORF type:complete len:104 (-),score=6.90 GHVU01049840.1:36-347(-)
MYAAKYASGRCHGLMSASMLPLLGQLRRPSIFLSLLSTSLSLSIDPTVLRVSVDGTLTRTPADRAQTILNRALEDWIIPTMAPNIPESRRVGGEESRREREKE